MADLDKLVSRLKRADDAVKAELERRFPIGTRVSCWIMAGQKRPSRGEVISYGASPLGGTLRVRLESRARDVRDVPVRYCEAL